MGVVNGNVVVPLVVSVAWKVVFEVLRRVVPEWMRVVVAGRFNVVCGRRIPIPNVVFGVVPEISLSGRSGTAWS